MLATSSEHDSLSPLYPTLSEHTAGKQGDIPATPRATGIATMGVQNYFDEIKGK